MAKFTDERFKALKIEVRFFDEVTGIKRVVAYYLDPLEITESKVPVDYYIYKAMTSIKELVSREVKRIFNF